MGADLTDDDAMKMAESMADAIAIAARKSAPKVEMKTCNRCGGKGHDFFLGEKNAQGICFKCWGKGEVVKGRNDAAMLTKLHAASEVERLRVLYRGHLLAISMLRGGMTSLRWGIESAIEDHVRQMANICEMGKAAKAAR